MNKHLKVMNLNKPLNSLFPWEPMKNLDNLEFRNLSHFIQVVSTLQQKQDDSCGISYKNAVKELQAGVSKLDEKEASKIKDLVRKNLHKRGLITEEVYEAYKYTESGTQVGIDVGKFAAGEPDCVITPTRQYISYFYELFINISYPYRISNSQILESCKKLLTTIEELERMKVFIKVTLIFPCTNPVEGRNFFMSVPLFSHKEYKDAKKMSSVVNDRLLRKFTFAILEEIYGDSLLPGYGFAENLDKSMNLGSTFDECAFFEEVLKEVGFK